MFPSEEGDPTSLKFVGFARYLPVTNKALSGIRARKLPGKTWDFFPGNFLKVVEFCGSSWKTMQNNDFWTFFVFGCFGSALREIERNLDVIFFIFVCIY